MGRKGFTLLEMIMVIVIMGISCGGLVVVMQQVVLNIHKPQIISTATALAEKEIERLIRMSFANTQNEPVQNYTGNFSNYSHKTLVNSIDANNKLVVVTINHAAIGNTSLAFLRTNY